MNILVTGNCGMIGSQLVKHLLTKPEVNMVVGIDDLSGGYTENLPPNWINNRRFQFYNMDAGDPKISYIFKNTHFDIVYHTAAWACEGASPFARRYTHTTNILCSANIINMCIEYGVGRLVYFSSMSTYGNGNGIVPFDEDKTPLIPIDPYGASKLCAETDVRIAGEQHHLPYVIVVPHNVYSSGQVFDRFRSVLSIWMGRTLRNKPMIVFGTGLQRRAFTHTSDILEPLWVAGTSYKPLGHRINLGGIKNISINEAARMTRDVMGKGEIIYKEPRHEVIDAYSTWQKSVDLLGFEHKTDLETGLKDLWQWAQTIKDKKIIEHELEIGNGLYSYWKEDI